MKRVIFTGFLIFFFASCTSFLYPKYTLTKKYPQSIPNLDLHILNDTTGVITETQDKSLKQNFGFIKKKRNFLIITSIDSINSLISLKKGDTVVYHRKEMYFFNDKHKLVFNKKE